MAAIMLHDPNDHATEQQVKTMLDGLAANPDNGIAEILDRDAIKKRGTYPDAAFLVVLKPGYYTANALSGSLVTPIPGHRGSHGFSPEYPEMRSSFLRRGSRNRAPSRFRFGRHAADRAYRGRHSACAYADSQGNAAACAAVKDSSQFVVWQFVAYSDPRDGLELRTVNCS